MRTPGYEYRSSSTIRQTTILFPHSVYSVTKWYHRTVPLFITNPCSDFSLLICVADRYVNDQINYTTVFPLSLSLSLSLASKYFTSLLKWKTKGESEMSSYLERNGQWNQMIENKWIKNREQNQWVIISNEIPIVGASVPLSQAQDHNMLCRLAIITNIFISTIKLCTELKKIFCCLHKEAGHNLI